MPVIRKLPPLPPPDVQLFDPRTGKLTVEGLRFLKALLAVLEEMRGLI